MDRKNKHIHFLAHIILIFFAYSVIPDNDFINLDLEEIPYSKMFHDKTNQKNYVQRNHGTGGPVLKNVPLVPVRPLKKGSEPIHALESEEIELEEIPFETQKIPEKVSKGTVPTKLVTQEKELKAPIVVTESIDLPIIGTIPLTSFVDPVTAQKGYSLPLPFTAQTISWGPLLIRSGSIKLIDGKLSYRADADFFGNKVKIGLKEATKKKDEEKKNSYKQATFGIEFDKENFYIEIFPGMKLKLVAADVVLEEQKPIKFILNTLLNTSELLLTITVQKEFVDIVCTVDTIKFGSLLKFMKNSSLEKAAISEVKMVASHVQFKNGSAVQPTYSIEGLCTIPSLDELRYASLTNIKFRGTLQKNKFSATMHLDSFVIPFAGLIENVQLTIDTSPEKKDVEISGVMHVDLPHSGIINVDVHSKMNSKGLEFTGLVEQPFPFAGIRIHDAKCKFSSDEKTVDIQGDAEIGDHRIRVELSKEYSGEFFAEGTFVSKTKIKPFGTIPYLSTISIEKPDLKFKVSDTEAAVSILGKINISTLTLDAELKYIKATTGETTAFLEAATPKNFKISELNSNLKNTFFDQLVIQQCFLIMVNHDYEDKVKQMMFYPGLNLMGVAHLEGPLAQIALLTHSGSEQLITLSAYIPKNPYEAVLRADIPMAITLKTDRLVLDHLYLEIAGRPNPSLSLITGITYFIQDRENPLHFEARIGIGAKEAVLAGTMIGSWEHPFGIKDFVIKNLALQIGFNYAVFSSTGLPSMIGMTGTTMIGSKSALIAANVSTTKPDDCMFLASLSELSLLDIIFVAPWFMDKKFPFLKIPYFSLKNVQLQIVPKGIKIGEISFEQGLECKGELFLPGFTGFVQLKLSHAGVIAQAYSSPISWGPLHITRSKKEKENVRLESVQELSVAKEVLKASQKDLDIALKQESKKIELLKTEPNSNRQDELSQATDAVRHAQDAIKKASDELSRSYAAANGPIIKIQLTLEQQELMVSGNISIGSFLEQDSYIKISTEGITFDLDGSLGTATYQNQPLLYGHLVGKSTGSLAEPDFILTLTFEQRLQRFMSAEIAKGIEGPLKQVTDGIHKAIEQVEKIKIASQKVNKKIDEAQKDIQSARDALKAINAAIEETTQIIEKQQTIVKNLKQEIADIEQSINNKKSEFQRMPWYEKVLYGWAKIGGELTELGIKFAGLQVAYNVANSVLEAAKQVSSGVMQGAKMTAEISLKAAEGFMENISRQIPIGVLKGAEETGKGVLIAARESALGVLKGTEFIAKNAINLIDLREIRYEGSLQKFATGILANITLRGKCFDTYSFDTSFDIDIDKPLPGLTRAIENAVKKIIQFIKSLGILQTLNTLFLETEPIEDIIESPDTLILPNKTKEEIEQLDKQIADTKNSVEHIKSLQSTKDDLIKKAEKMVEEKLQAERQAVNKKIELAKNKKNAMIAKEMVARGESITNIPVVEPDTGEFFEIIEEIPYQR